MCGARENRCDESRAIGRSGEREGGPPQALAWEWVYAGRANGPPTRRILKTWDVFNPVVALFNEKRRKLFRSGMRDHDVLVMTLDETMLAWLPHHALTGGLPNTTHCKRKPKPHGTEIRDAARGDFKVVCTPRSRCSRSTCRS